MQNFIRAFLWISAIFILEYAKSHRFWDFFYWKIFAKASSKQTETSYERFCLISIPNSKYEFSKSREKFFLKKFATIFLKEGSKESWGNTEEKVGLRQPDILTF
jgi:hypothetical protein